MKKELKRIKKKAESYKRRMNLAEKKVNKYRKELSIVRQSCPHPKGFLTRRLVTSNTMFEEEPYYTIHCELCGWQGWDNL